MYMNLSTFLGLKNPLSNFLSFLSIRPLLSYKPLSYLKKHVATHGHFFLIYSRQLLEELSGEDLSNENFPFSTHKVLNIAGHKVRALRLTFVGEMGWELHIPKNSCVPVYDALIQHGQRFNISNGGKVLPSFHRPHH